LAHHASSQSAQRSSGPVTLAKSPGSTPWAVKRGPQLATAEVISLSGTGRLPPERA